jgi:hypothetical protein
MDCWKMTLNSMQKLMKKKMDLRQPAFPMHLANAGQ